MREISHIWLWVEKMQYGVGLREVFNDPHVETLS